MYGSVVFYKRSQGYGFVRAADRPADIFFHHSEFRGDSRSLQIGAKVEFELGERKGQPIARDVRLLEVMGASDERN